MNRKNQTENSKIKQKEENGEGVAIADDADVDDSQDQEEFDDGDGLAQSDSNAITIPHGLQLLRKLPHPRPTLRGLLYIPGYDATLASLDYSSMHIWKKGNLVKSLDVSGESGPVGGINHWVYMPKWKTIAISTNQLQLKVDMYNNFIAFEPSL